ncbi:Pc06g02070 [Penicillium rubens Wisconsin 54-1255]|uniref:Pc06g02070 protein n=1 Tax=Penicillium rubens (strain ATCC 28089 / DSM 1075 / NRRL 1951 / Wisconsin 54-1255) TaxID=500485 RepID=B6GWA8_PENRW|nr:Pc06g02070 [Penicillium rubens Wisconsin 54-1255]
MHESTKGTEPDNGVSTRDSAPIRLHTVRILFSHDITQLMKDIKRNGLDDVVVDAVPLQELGAQHQAQDEHGCTKNAFLVDLAVLESGILRVRMKYGIIKFIPLSSDDPIVLQQPTTDPDLKKALCYQHLHSKYLQEYGKKRDLAEALGYEMHKYLKNWYDECLRDITRRLEQLGYF